MKPEQDKQPVTEESAREAKLPEGREARSPEASENGAAPKFQFKILPANPKNSFDFEDVADK